MNLCLSKRRFAQSGRPSTLKPVILYYIGQDREQGGHRFHTIDGKFVSDLIYHHGHCKTIPSKPTAAAG